MESGVMPFLSAESEPAEPERSVTFEGSDSSNDEATDDDADVKVDDVVNDAADADVDAINDGAAVPSACAATMCWGRLAA